MSLLTEKQIAEIIDMATQQAEFAEILKLKLDHWNKNQTTQQFELDWSAAPKHAVMAAINLAWLTENGNWTLGYRAATYKRPAPIIVPHPHAALIMKYAEAAQRRIDPWVEFEIKDSDTGVWTALNIPITFFEECEYRHIGDKP